MGNAFPGQEISSFPALVTEWLQKVSGRFTITAVLLAWKWKTTFVGR
jgi:hypothetical protein